MKLLEWSVDSNGTMHAHVQPSEVLGQLPKPMWITIKLPKIYLTNIILITNTDVSKCIREIVVTEEFYNTEILTTERSKEYVREFYTLTDSFSQQVIVNALHGYWVVCRVSHKLVWSSFIPLMRRIEKFYSEKLQCPELWIGGEDTIYAVSPYPVRDDHCYYTLRNGNTVKRSLPIPVFKNNRWSVEVNVNNFSNLVGESYLDMTMRLVAKIDSLNELIT